MPVLVDGNSGQKYREAAEKHTQRIAETDFHFFAHGLLSLRTVAISAFDFGSTERSLFYRRSTEEAFQVGLEEPEKPEQCSLVLGPLDRLVAREIVVDLCQCTTLVALVCVDCRHQKIFEFAD